MIDQQPKTVDEAMLLPIANRLMYKGAFCPCKVEADTVRWWIFGSEPWMLIWTENGWARARLK